MAEPIDDYFTAAVTAAPGSGGRPTPGGTLSEQAWLDLFDAQLGSRHLDLAARWLRSQRQGLLHDRLVGPRGQRRGRRGAAADRPGAAALPVRRVLPGPRRASRRQRPVARRAARAGRRDRRADRPAGGTRCSAATTCTSSRRPRPSPRTCRGRSAWRSRIGRVPRSCGVACPGPPTRSVVCSFGDASVNHSTAVGAHQHRDALRLPGPAAAAAVRLRGQRHRHQRADPARLGRRGRTRPAPACAYFSADGCRPRRRRSTPTLAAAEWVRDPPQAGVPAPAHGAADGARRAPTSRAPTAGRDEIAADMTADPLLGTARLLVEAGLLTPAEVLEPLRAQAASGCWNALPEVAGRAAAATAPRQVMAPLAPRSRTEPTVRRPPSRPPACR